MIKNNNMKRVSRVSLGETPTHNYRYSCGFRTTRLCACACGEHEEFSTSGGFDI